MILRIKIYNKALRFCKKATWAPGPLLFRNYRNRGIDGREIKLMLKGCCNKTFIAPYVEYEQTYNSL